MSAWLAIRYLCYSTTNRHISATIGAGLRISLMKRNSRQRENRHSAATTPLLQKVWKVNASTKRFLSSSMRATLVHRFRAEGLAAIANERQPQ